MQKPEEGAYALQQQRVHTISFKHRRLNTFTHPIGVDVQPLSRVRDNYASYLRLTDTESSGLQA